MCNAAYPAENGDTAHSVFANGQFYLFVKRADEVKLYTSSDAVAFSPAATDGLPQDMNVKSVLFYNGKFYYAQADMLYSSSDGSQWQSETTENDIERLLFAFNDSLWAISHRNEQLVLCVTGDAQNWREETVLPSAFPVDRFASATFQSSSLRQRASIIGGIDKDGKPPGIE